VGEFTALVLLAEIGDITRFGTARRLASWAGLTPTVRGWDLTVRHGHISKQGSPYVRWVLGQAAQIAKQHPEFAATYERIAKRRGTKIATVAVARKLLTRAYHLLANTDTHAESAGTIPDNSTGVTRIPRTRPPTGRVTKSRVRSPQRHEPATSRARASD
jgi:transposase